MAKTPDLLGYLEQDPGTLRDLVPGPVLAELESTSDYDGQSRIRTKPGGEETYVDIENVREHLGEGDYFEMHACRVAATTHLDVTYAVAKHLESYGDRPPVVQVYFHARGLHAPDAHELTDRMVEFVLTLYDHLPVEFFHLVTNGPMQTDWMPERDEYARNVLKGTTFLNVLGPSVVATFDRGTLLSAPAYEVRELDDDGVLLRGAELIDDWTGAESRAIREHLQLQ